MKIIKHHSINDLLSNRVIATNTLWNLIGFCTPLIVAIFAVPILISNIGTAKFGILTLTWAIAGYFSLFDLGMGRALTKLIAESLAKNNVNDACELIWTALFLMSIIGFIGMLILILFSPILITNVLKIDTNLQIETINSFYLLSLSIPIVVISNGFRGILEAFQRFDLVNKVRIPLGILIFIAPVFVLPFSKSLVWLVASLVFVRYLAAIANALICFKMLPDLLSKKNTIRLRLLRPLIKILVTSSYGVT